MSLRLHARRGRSAHRRRQLGNFDLERYFLAVAEQFDRNFRTTSVWDMTNIKLV